MIFITFAFLVAHPVHEKAVCAMDHFDGDDHVHGNAERGDAAEESGDESERAKKFSGDGEDGKHRGDVHLVGERVIAGAEAVAAEPAEDFLRAVREHDDAEGQARECGRETVVGFEEEFHSWFLVKDYSKWIGSELALTPALSPRRG